MPSFEEIFGLAMHLKYIQDLEVSLRTRFNGALLVALYFDNESEEKIQKDKFFKENKEIIKLINKEVKTFNFKLNEKYSFLPSKPLETISLDKVNKIIYEHKGKDSTSREHTVLKLNNCLLALDNSIKKFLDSFDLQLTPFLGRKFPDWLGSDNHSLIKEAFDIYSIGYFQTSVFLMGKCLEKNITNLIMKGIDKKRLNYSLVEVKKWSFDTKINILKKHGFLLDKDHSKILSIKWDRNIAGHPSDDDEIERLRRESSGIITICLSQIIEIKKMIDNLKSEIEIKQDESRRILGGKTEGGFPILYGSPERQLKQLKGYGGKRIEEIREAIKKEIVDKVSKEI